MPSFESKKSSISERKVQDVEKENSSETFPTKEMDKLSTEIDSFLKHTLDVLPEDVKRLEILKNKISGVKLRFGKILRATLFSSAVLLGGLQNTIASEDEVGKQAASEFNMDSEIYKRIQEYKSSLMNDVTERLALYYDGNEVLEKQSNLSGSVKISGVEAKAYADTELLKSQTVLHTHPIAAVTGSSSIFGQVEAGKIMEGKIDLPALAPSSIDIISIQMEQAKHPEIENKSIVIGPRGVWHLSIDTKHSATQKFSGLLELKKHLNEEVRKISISTDALGRSLEEVSSDFTQKATEHIVDVLGEKILERILELDKAQYNLAHSKNDISRQYAVSKYKEAANMLGIEIEYEENSKL